MDWLLQLSKCCFAFTVILREKLYTNCIMKNIRGLGIETIFANILKAYSDPGNLVIVLGTTDYDERYLIELLKSFGTNMLPRIVNAECSSNERYVKNNL